MNDIKLLSVETGKSANYIKFILNGTRRPGPALAAKLEKLTGVPRMSWLYPDEYPNPLIKKNSNAQPDSQ
jgi:hypothetical protein